MADFKELKLKALAATSGPWVAGGPSIDGKNAVYFDEVVTAKIIGVIHGNTTLREGICVAPDGSETTSSANLLYISTANPAVVLELIRQRDELLDALKDVVGLWDGRLHEGTAIIANARSAIANAEA